MLQSFESERLILRERTLEDIEKCIEMDHDLEVVKYIPEIVELINGPHASYKKHREFVRKRIETVYPNGLGYWTIELKDHIREFIGWVMLIPIDNIGPETEIGWRLKRNHWGKGYATEAARIILQYAFDTIELDKIVADIHYLNRGSIRVAEKIGLKFEGLNDDNTNHYVRYSIY
ncbi:Protein N-acetyltransferase, RimJ/RimL family [Salinibacillus kushneri]|uniref:Protein N-acetyltransferase, RimJ/RimL family n=1 Tax=Salinibacillus kushneri TaxID=237682 RepID=A0A1I0DRM9_9BACI|nr:GNAT family N-acetyltransferase [Salinibacillus kushneri]SET35233.1 Protein N-acetyltransferase, RimJ/RimL family [Salinibacillus kushneri]